MKCMCCKKKTSVLLKCKYCDIDTCVGCRDLNTHACTGLYAKIQSELKSLDKRLEYKVSKQNDLLHR